MRIRPKYTWRVDSKRILHIEARWKDDGRNFGLEVRVHPGGDPVAETAQLMKAIQHTQMITTRNREAA